MTNEEAIQMLKNIQVALSAIYEGEPFKKCNDALNKAINSLQIPNIFHEFVFKATKIEIPPNATNGDIIKTLYPMLCAKGEYGMFYFNSDITELSYMNVTEKFWNAPYKVESGE